MAKEQRSASTDAKAVGSIIAPDMRITGECRVEGALRVDGTIEGTVHGRKSVVVTRTGRVRGRLETPEAVVAGTVDGLLTCSDRLEFEATGRFEGELRSPALRVGDGAKLNGYVEVGSAVAERRGRDEGPGQGERERVRSAS